MSVAKTDNQKKTTILRVQEMKARKEPISMLTAYDYTMAKLIDEAGIDVILVGDSAANVMAGHETTLPITLDQMIYHTQMVKRGVKQALVVADLPFGTYQGNSKLALASAVQMMREGGSDCVKIEGGREIKKSVQRILSAGIPIMGHLGLTPQSIHQFGSYGVRAKSDSEAERLIEDAKLLEELGCFAIVLEKIPADLAGKISSLLTIPTIGIGAGNQTDGQVLVMHDMLGLNQGFTPKFLRKFAELGEEVKTAVGSYITEVKGRSFPNESEQY